MGFTHSLKSFMDHKPKELRRLYEPLSTLCALHEQVPDGNNSILTEGRGMGIQQRRRDFVNAIAYLGAFKKDCDLAVAVRKNDRGKAVITVAGSRSISQDIVPFLTGLSEMVEKGISGPLDHDTKQLILSVFSDYVMKYHKENIFVRYRDMMNDIVPKCLRLMTNESQKAEVDEIHILDFRAWFQKVFFRDDVPLLEEDMSSLAQECFSSYQSSRFDIIKHFLYQGQIYTEELERFDEMLREIGKPIKMTQLLYGSATALAQDLRTGIEVEGIPQSPPLQIPLLKKKLTPEGILHRMFSQADREEQLREQLYAVASMQILSEQLHHYADTILTQVHPELLIINYFDKLSIMDFFDNSDKYIGCSNASCYLCYQYISNHPNRYIVEPASQEINLQWRLPDISMHENHTAAWLKHQQLVLRKLTEHVRKDLESFVYSHYIRKFPYNEQQLDDIDSRSTLKTDEDSIANCDQWSLNSDKQDFLAEYGLLGTRSINSHLEESTDVCVEKDKEFNEDDNDGGGGAADDDDDDDDVGVVTFRGRG